MAAVCFIDEVTVAENISVPNLVQRKLRNDTLMRL